MLNGPRAKNRILPGGAALGLTHAPQFHAMVLFLKHNNVQSEGNPQIIHKPNPSLSWRRPAPPVGQHGAAVNHVPDGIDPVHAGLEVVVNCNDNYE